MVRVCSLRVSLLALNNTYIFLYSYSSWLELLFVVVSFVSHLFICADIYILGSLHFNTRSQSLPHITATQTFKSNTQLHVTEVQFQLSSGGSTHILAQSDRNG